MNPGPDWGALVSGWQLAPGPLVLLASAAAAYAIGVRRARRWPARRTAGFGVGLAALAVALLSGVDARGHDQLSTHMLQHLLMTLVAAPLIVAGAPLSLALQATSGTIRRGLARAVRAVRPLAWPPVAFALFAGATLATHLTGFYDAALRSPPLHSAEHVLYLSTALFFWLPVAGTNPVPQLRSFAGRAVYLLFAMPPMVVVGAVLISAEGARYASYAGPGALVDQQAAGAIMWVGGGLIMTAALLVAGFAAMLAEERRQRAIDGLERAIEAGA